MRFQVIAAAWYLLGVERVDHCWRQVCANETALNCSTAFFDCTSVTDPALRGVRASWAANTQVVTQCVDKSMQPGGYFNYGEEARGSPPQKLCISGLRDGCLVTLNRSRLSLFLSCLNLSRLS
jgi:hypothetical protein